MPGPQSLRTSAKCLHPWRYRAIIRHLERHRSGQDSILDKAHQKLRSTIKQNGIKTIAEKPEKNTPIAFIVKCITTISIDEIFDVYAIRIITQSIDECYRVLGIVHTTYPPRQNFKDYIAIPKANGYQSLHTIVAGPDGVPIEVQIRSQSMDEQANQGVAAHWSYKSGSRIVIQSEIKRQQWLDRIQNMETDQEDPVEFVEKLKTTFINEIYVFNQNGEIIELPMAPQYLTLPIASILTRAITVCLQKLVKFVPLTTKLSNGQTVEVITAKT